MRMRLMRDGKRGKDMSLGSEYLSDHAYEIHSAQAESVCGRCKWNRFYKGGFMCGNEDSEYSGCYTEYADSCDRWEERMKR